MTEPVHIKADDVRLTPGNVYVVFVAPNEDSGVGEVLGVATTIRAAVKIAQDWVADEVIEDQQGNPAQITQLTSMSTTAHFDWVSPDNAWWIQFIEQKVQS